MEMPFKQRQQKLRKVLSPLLKKYPAPSREQFLKMDVLDLVMWSAVSADPFDPNVPRAFSRLTGDFVDWNEARVSSTNELGELLQGCRLNPERAVHIKNTAQLIFYKENRLSLDFLSTREPADIKKYISSLKRFPETQADVIMILLSNAADIPPIPSVDRFSRRVGFLLSDATNNAIRLIYKKTLPQSQTYNAFYAICKHTQTLCKEKNPRCGACFLNKKCDYGVDKTGRKTRSSSSAARKK